MDYLLEVENLTIKFFTKDGTVHAVDKVSFKLKKGEILGIVGESGSGKSTLGKALAGLIDYQGSVLYDGVNINQLNSAAYKLTIKGNLQRPNITTNPKIRRVT